MKNIIVVVGGSSGIGKAICHNLRDNYQVINMSRRKNEEVENIYCDVTKPDIVKQSFRELKDKFGIPDIMVYSAGYVLPQSILEIDENVLEETFRVNTIGAFYVVQEFVRYNNKKSGKIILIASTSGMRPVPGLSAYGSAKSSLISFGLSMSEELKGYGIKIYVVSLGRCNTKLRDAICLNEDKSKIMQPYETSLVIESLIKDPGLLDGQNLVIRKSIGN